MAKSKSQRIGTGAFYELRKLTSERYPSQLGRVNTWEPTIKAAFQAVAAGQANRQVNLPAGVTSTETGANTDKAFRVLSALDALLGRGVTMIALTNARTEAQ